MKLAEALILRADYQKRIEQLRQRLVRNAKVQEGESPAEEPRELLEEMERVAVELVRLIQRINKTNVLTTLDNGMSLADAIANRDVIKTRQNIYRDLTGSATITQDRLTRSEVKFKSTVSVGDMQKLADQLAKEYRELDARLQEANWKTDLIE